MINGKYNISIKQIIFEKRKLQKIRIVPDEHNRRQDGLGFRGRRGKQ
jgi:hypothetical protein